MNTQYSRRQFLQQSSLATMGLLLSQGCKKNAHNPTILVVSGWQDVNIGDIAHTPGLLQVLKSFVPQAHIILWKKRVENSLVEPLILENYPKVRIVHGEVNNQYQVESQEVLQAFDQADLMIHGSGPGIIGRDNLQAWVDQTGKPFGIFGTTIASIDDQLAGLLRKASFIYTRETKSLDVLKQNGITGDHLDFAPDATFYLDLSDDEQADKFLRLHGLEQGQYICAVPRLRYTPYHKIKRDVNWTPEKIAQVESTNEKYGETDHAKMREAIIRWVRTTGNKVLVCPEMTYQVNIMDELLINPLPEDVKPSVIKRGYWMPDEAASIYRKAFSVLSFECHSPIIALANGTPAMYLRQPEDTIKGQMYYDLKLSNWVFEIDETDGEQIADQLMNIWEAPKSADQVINGVYARIDDIYRRGCEPINAVLNA